MSGPGPRIGPVDPGQSPPEVERTLAAPLGETGKTLGDLNLFRTMARHPELFRSWLPLGGFLLGSGTLPARDRELLILRTALVCDCGYEWGQHVRIAAPLGIGPEELGEIAEGPGAAGLDRRDAALLRAVDELHRSSGIAEATWSELSDLYDDRQLMEVAMVVGHYHMVAFALNAFGIEPERDLEDLPEAPG